MRIAVITPTRGRPGNVIALSHVLERLASGQHDIVHYITCDDDEPPLPMDLFPSIARQVRGPRPDSIGEVWNAPFKVMDDYDVCTFVGDDVMPLQPKWDDGIAWLASKHEVSAWRETIYPDAATYPIMTKRFVDALNGEPYVSWFPYWFVDPWLNEVVTFAFGKGIPIVTDLQLYSREHGQTMGMRDLAFWVNFFIKERPSRVLEGRELAKAYGLPIRDPRSAIAFFEETDKMWPERIPYIERTHNANRGEPSARYLRAKEKAERWMTCAA